MSENTQTVFDFVAATAAGEPYPLEQLRGQVLLLVNTATKCGLAPQFEQLEELWQRYREQGLVVLGFPCNQFMSQEPGESSEVEQVCRLNHGVTFPILGKIEVNGDGADPLYRWLRAQTGGMFGDAIKWNFTKFLVDRSGTKVKRFAPTTKPLKLSGDIEALL